MPWYRCLIRGEHFPGRLIGQSQSVGFYVTRFVEAADPATAETIALQMLRADPKLAPPTRFQPSGREQVFVEEIEACSAAEVPSVLPGFAWFPIDDCGRDDPCSPQPIVSEKLESDNPDSDREIVVLGTSFRDSQMSPSPDKPPDWLTRQRTAFGNFDLGALNAVGWLLFLASLAIIGLGLYALAEPPKPDGGWSGGTLSPSAERRLIAAGLLLAAVATFWVGRWLLRWVGVSIYRASRRETDRPQ